MLLMQGYQLIGGVTILVQQTCIVAALQNKKRSSSGSAVRRQPVMYELFKKMAGQIANHSYNFRLTGGKSQY